MAPSLARRRTPPDPRSRRWGIALASWLVGGCLAPTATPLPPRPCIPRWQATASCPALDDDLVAARQPLLACVGHAADGGRLDEAHRCYRALRLLESARWWLETLSREDRLVPVYQPAEATRREFLCRLEGLAAARDAATVERLYLEMIRSFP